MARRKEKGRYENLKGPKYKFDVADHIVAENWHYERAGKNFFDNDYLEIIEYFCLHSPCRQGSYSPCTLDDNGWVNPWQSNKFRDKFKSLLSLDEHTLKVEEYQYKFKSLWESSDYKDFINIRKPFALLAAAGETNDYMNLLHRVRNSLAHGRYIVKNDRGEYYFYFEDVKSSNGTTYVLARICLTKTGLSNLRKFLMRESDAAKGLESIIKEKSGTDE